MQLIEQDADARLIETTGNLRNAADGYYVLYYHLSQLQKQFRSNYQVKISINILKDIFKGQLGKIFLRNNQDVVLLYKGNDRGLIEKAIFQVRYLYMDDPLSYNDDGFENDSFCTVYDLEFQWREFFNYSKGTVAPVKANQQRQGDGHPDKIQDTTPRSQTIPEPEFKHAPTPTPMITNAHIITPVHKKEKLTLEEFASLAMQYSANQTQNQTEASHDRPTPLQMSPDTLSSVMSELRSLDISPAIAKQSVFAFPNAKCKPTPLFHELFIHIHSLQNLLAKPVDLLEDKTLFKYLTETLDLLMLSHLNQEIKAKRSLPKAFSLNINCKTILSDVFNTFNTIVDRKRKGSIILEINIADIFDDIHRFFVARKIAHDHGYRLCIDGIDLAALPIVYKNDLGFDLAKIKWSQSLVQDTEDQDLSQFKQLVNTFGPNRVILCHCDDQQAVRFGHNIGIALYQGHHFDPSSRLIPATTPAERVTEKAAEESNESTEKSESKTAIEQLIRELKKQSSPAEQPEISRTEDEDEDILILA